MKENVKVEQLFKLQNLHEMPVDCNLELYTIPCRIKENKRIGQYFGCVLICEKSWGIVLLSGEKKPTIIDIDKIEVLRLNWVDLKIESILKEEQW